LDVFLNRRLVSALGLSRLPQIDCSQIHSILILERFILMNKIYIGNLPYTVTEDSLEALFSQYGKVEEVILIKDRETRRLKGFGFIVFSTDNEANAALAMNGQELEGRALKVNIAQEREKTGGRSEGGRGKRW